MVLNYLGLMMSSLIRKFPPTKLLNFWFVRSNKMKRCQISSNALVTQVVVEFGPCRSPKNLPWRTKKERERERERDDKSFQKKIIIKGIPMSFPYLGDGVFRIQTMEISPFIRSKGENPSFHFLTLAIFIIFMRGESN